MLLDKLKPEHSRYYNNTVKFLIQVGELAFFNDYDPKQICEILNDGRKEYWKMVFTYRNYMYLKIKAVFEMRNPDHERKGNHWKKELGERSVRGDLGTGKKYVITYDDDYQSSYDRRRNNNKKRQPQMEKSVITGNNSNQPKMLI